MHKAIEGSGSQRGRVTHQDLVFLVRKDERKYNRCVELLDMNEELKRARKVCRRHPLRRSPL
jgi:transcription initiation factor TFIID subunit 13